MRTRNGCLLLAFAVVVVLSDRAISSGLARLIQISSFRIVELYEGRVDADVIIIGNSRGLNIDARRLSQASCLRAYSLALNALDVRTMQALMEDYLAQNKKPKLTILEISNLIESDYNYVVAAQLTPFPFPGSKLLSLASEVRDTILPWRTAFHLLRFNSELFFRALYYIGKHDDQDWTGELGSFSREKIDAYLLANKSRNTSDAQLDTLAALVKQLREAEIEPVLVLLPYHPAALARGEWDQQLVQRVGERVGGDNIVFSFARSFQSDSMFADAMHLSRSGKAELVRVLVGRLTERGFVHCSSRLEDREPGSANSIGAVDAR
jgi:hypothetical protein